MLDNRCDGHINTLGEEINVVPYLGAITKRQYRQYGNGKPVQQCLAFVPGMVVPHDEDIGSLRDR